MTAPPGTDRRSLFLVAACLSTALVLGKAVFLPNQKRPTPTLPFPQTVRLEGFLSVSSEPTVDRDSANQPLQGHRYHYRVGPQTVDARLFLLKDDDVSIENLVRINFGEPGQPELREDSSGFRGVYARDGRVHLSACLFPSGRSTFTPEQFRREAFRQQVQQVWPWLLAQRSFAEKQCLWVYLTTDGQMAVPPGKATGLLENAWTEIQQQWSPRLERLDAGNASRTGESKV